MNFPADACVTWKNAHSRCLHSLTNLWLLQTRTTWRWRSLRHHWFLSRKEKNMKKNPTSFLFFLYFVSETAHGHVLSPCLSSSAVSPFISFCFLSAQRCVFYFVMSFPSCQLSLGWEWSEKWNCPAGSFFCFLQDWKNKIKYTKARKQVCVISKSTGSTINH